jgi:hypothetical protein
MATMSISAPAERHGTLRDRLSVVPWLTVLPLAVMLAFADGFWMISMRGAAGSIERTQAPFGSWLRDSTLSLPIFVLAVIGALALAARWFGPVLRKPKTVVAGALLVVAAGTLVGIGVLAASSAYDYHLQIGQVQLMDSMRSAGSMASMAMGSPESQQQATLGLQVKAVGLGSGLLLATNLVLVGWLVALRGGRLAVSTTRA